MLLISAISLGLLGAMVRPSPRHSSRIKPMLLTALLTLLVCTAALAAAIAWGGPRDIQPLSSVNAPFDGVDWSGIPTLQRYSARDGTSLAGSGPRIVFSALARENRGFGIWSSGNSSKRRARISLSTR